jgi:hypothetical protein
MTDTFKLSLAPDRLWQSINPWTFYNQGAQFGFINVNLGQTPRPDIEQAVLDEVGSYGRQLGRIGDALEVLIDRLEPAKLSRDEADAIAILKGQLAAVRKIKHRERAKDPAEKG